MSRSEVKIKCQHAVANVNDTACQGNYHQFWSKVGLLGTAHLIWVGAGLKVGGLQKIFRVQRCVYEKDFSTNYFDLVPPPMLNDQSLTTPA